jgi:hypothetical protein
MTKAAFARHVGLTTGRISHLLKKGLPVRADGKLDPVKAKAWMAANLDPQRRAAAGQDAPNIAEARSAKLTAEAAIADLKARRTRGELVERAQIELFLKTRAIFERDAWLSLASSKAGELAAACGCDVATAYAVLDKIVREQLCELARVPVVLPDASLP